MIPHDIPIGIVGGSGLYGMEGIEHVEEVSVTTPYGEPSDRFRVGTLGGRKVVFLARHGRSHRLSPSEIPHRANIHALRQLGVRWVLSASAVGSLKEQFPPGHFVFPSQFVDRTKRAPEAQTFFGHGIVAHVAFGDPICTRLQGVYYAAAQAVGAPSHLGGTYVNMEGPAFSTKAESHFHRVNGWDVIGMTNLAEAKLCREAEISYATMAMVTDFDCWHEQEVTVAEVVKQLHANGSLAQAVIARAIGEVPLGESPPAQKALATAILTPRVAWDDARIEELRPFLNPYL